jgi:large subunit ribosomal protein L4
MTSATTAPSASRTSVRRRQRPDPAVRTVARRSSDGTVLGDVRLAPEIFGIEPNVAVMHQVVTAQLAAARSGTQSTKTRAEVRGGGAKPYKQKGTGRARQGSTRSPQWAGGGVALGPKPRSYRQRTPKKMVRLALHSALSDRAATERVALVDEWGFEAPRTKDALAALEALEITGKVLVVLDPGDTEAAFSFRNLPDVHIIAASELNAYDVLRSDWVVFTDATVPGGVEPVEASAPAKATRARRAAAPAADEDPVGGGSAPDEVSPAEASEDEPTAADEASAVAAEPGEDDEDEGGEQ